MVLFPEASLFQYGRDILRASLHFVVLVPHRDAGKILRDYSRGLFRAGVAGAWSFPRVAPLALVSQLFSPGELKTLARELRDLSLTRGRDGKILAVGTGAEPFPSRPLSFFGPVLDLESKDLPALTNAKVLRIPARFVLCAGLAPAGLAEIPPAPSLAFRAAMAANLSVRPLDGGDGDYSFEWRIGKPVWLPHCRM